jgi:hypothetical protein
MLSYTHVSVVYNVYMFISILYLYLYIYIFSVPLYMVIENKDGWYTTRGLLFQRNSTLKI